jgi:hypothetical protein
VTWEPETGSRANTIVKEIRLNPDNIDEGGMTLDSDAMNPKGEAGPRVESTSGMMTRLSAKRGKVSMKRKPRLASSLTGRRASHEADTGAFQEKARKLKPKFRVGEVVRFRAKQAHGEEIQPWKRGVVTDLLHPGDPEDLWEDQYFNYLVLSDRLDAKGRMEETVTSETDMEALSDFPFVESKKKTVLVISLLNTLHDLTYVGIVTCSAVSVSTERNDFAFIDDSQEARDSVILRGVGGENTVIGGRGPMVVQTKDAKGNDVLVFDPSGVYLDQAELDAAQARFRIFGQSRLKRAGLKIHQDKYDDGMDYLVYRGGQMEIPTDTIDDIVAMKTTPLDLSEEQEKGLTDHLREIIGNSKERKAFVKLEECSSFIMNEANVSREQMARLIHWRQAHRQSGEGVIHENACPICEEGKRKTKGFKRNQDYRAQVTKKNPPYHRIYADGYGGQNSMGEESY